MINLDPYILEWVSGNWLAMTILLTILKGVALISPNTHDDKIYTLLSGLFGQLRGKPPAGVPPLKDRGDTPE